MEIQQNKFAFFANFAETIRCLPEEKQAPAYKALCEYGIYGILPEDESLRIMCLMSSASVFKEDGRKNNGGNHNPKGINQHTNSGQSRSNLVNSGQSLSKQETETETETERERESVERKNKGSFVVPTEQDFLTLAKQWNDMAGCGGFKNTEQQATDFWNYYNSQGWLKSNGQHLTNVQSAYKLWVQRDNELIAVGIKKGKPEPTAENKQEIKTAWVGFSVDYDNIQDFDDNFPWDKAYHAYCETKNKYPGEPVGQKMREIMRYVYSNSNKLHRLHSVSPHLVFNNWGDFMQKDKCSWVDVF